MKKLKLSTYAVELGVVVKGKPGQRFDLQTSKDNKTFQTLLIGEIGHNGVQNIIIKIPERYVRAVLL